MSTASNFGGVQIVCKINAEFILAFYNFSAKLLFKNKQSTWDGGKPPTAFLIAATLCIFVYNFRSLPVKP